MPLKGCQVVVGLSFVLIFSALPFKGVLGLGTHHAGWVIGLTLLGWSPQAALDIATLFHLILLGYTLLLGGLGWGMLNVL
jgi:hypothetical protein